MPASSNYLDVLNAVAGAISALGITFSGTPLPVAVRKLPRAEEQIDTLPLVCVVPKDEPEGLEVLDFEGGRDLAYPAEIVIVSAGNRDLNATSGAANQVGLDNHMNWRQQIRNSLKGPSLSGAATVWHMETSMELVLDRELVNLDYDYSGLIVRCRSRE